MTRSRRFFAAVAIVAIPLVWFAWGLPGRSRVRELATSTPTETSVMRQRAKEAVSEKRSVKKRQQIVPIARISRHLIHAVVAAEDPKFFGHEGLDWEAIQESLERNIEKRSFARGGSTITQQLAKNLFFTTHKNLVRKAREVVVTRWLEEDLTKKRILELYLNVIEWGDGVYGCEAAAERYYRTTCAALDEAQAAGLAAMIPSPRRINPRVNPQLHARATRRVLWLMRGAGYLKREIRYLGKEMASQPPIVVDDRGADPPEPDRDPSPDAELPEVVATPVPSPTATPDETIGAAANRSRFFVSRENGGL